VKLSAGQNTCETLFEVEKKEIAIDKLQKEVSSEDFWKDEQNANLNLARLKNLKAEINPVNTVAKDLNDLHEIIKLCDDKDTDLLLESEEKLATIEKAISQLELRVFFSGKNDNLPAFLSIHAGAGGTDACDWAGILLRMYTRWFEKKGFSYRIVDTLPGDSAGIRSATISVEGEYVYGNLKSEIGVHRLVRISPFDSNKRRHTSFASVDVIPQVEDIKIEIKESDLKIDTFRAGGKGGQHVNVTDSAVRITHVPTGVVAQCQNERSQHQNKKVAMKILLSKLYQLKEKEHSSELARMYSEKGEIAWGNQIRSYVLQPYTLVKDHRTEYQTGNIQSVLDGELDDFVSAFLRWGKRKY
jgi:peptide chain release factor 2